MSNFTFSGASKKGDFVLSELVSNRNIDLIADGNVYSPHFNTNILKASKDFQQKKLRDSQSHNRLIPKPTNANRVSRSKSPLLIPTKENENEGAMTERGGDSSRGNRISIPHFPREVFSAGEHVRDIRKRMRNYQPIVENRDKSPREQSILDVNSQVYKEVKADIKVMKNYNQIKNLKRNELEKKFKEVVEASDKEIRTIFQELQSLRPEEYKFNQRLIREFDELSDLKHKINDTFDIISDKNPQVTQLQTLQRFENKILESCKTCESQKGQTAIRDILAMKNKAEDNIHIHERLQTGDEEGTLRFSPFGDERLNTGPDKTQRVSLSPIKFDSKRTEDEKSPNYPPPHRKLKLHEINTRASSQDIRRVQTEMNENINDLNNKFYFRINSNTKKNEKGKVTDGKNSNENSKTNNEKVIVKLTKVPSSGDKYILKLTTRYNSSEIVIREGETSELYLPRNFLGDFYEENKRGGLTGRDFNHFNDQSSENRSNTILNDNFMNQTPVGQLNQGTYRDFEFNKKLDPFCVDCCVKIEGLKTIMKDMIEIDKVALPITSDYTEYIISKMGLEKKDILLQYGNKELIAKTLNTSCTTVRLLLDSCYTLAPYHAQGFEKVFKTICYFFELMIRAHTTSQKNLILQLEHVSIYLKEKHTLNEQLAKLKELNSQMLFDLKNVDLTHKETIDRQERKISNLNKRIEYLQFKAFGTEGDDVEFY